MNRKTIGIGKWLQSTTENLTAKQYIFVRARISGLSFEQAAKAALYKRPYFTARWLEQHIVPYMVEFDEYFRKRGLQIEGTRKRDGRWRLLRWKSVAPDSGPAVTDSGSP